MTSARTRWAATTASLAVGLTAAVIGPGVADELLDPAGAATQVDTVDTVDGSNGSTALERRRGNGNGHAYGLTERPADGGGLARGHAKSGGQGLNGDGAPGLSDPADREAAKAERAAEREAAKAARGTPDHTHGNGKAAGHSHGDSLAPGHVHPVDIDDAAGDVADDATDTADVTP